MGKESWKSRKYRWKKKYGSGSKGGGNSKNLIISGINRGTQNTEKIQNNFTNKHDKADHEYAVVNDSSGNIINYVSGDKGSVQPQTGIKYEQLKNSDIYHNHPIDGWGNFSDGDLLYFAYSGARSISASSVAGATSKGVRNKEYYENFSNKTKSTGAYKISRTNHFDSKGFVDSLAKEWDNISNSSNYDSSMNSFLRKNANKYGYKYTYKPDATAKARGTKSVTAGSSKQRKAYYDKLNGKK